MEWCDLPPGRAIRQAADVAISWWVTGAGGCRVQNCNTRPQSAVDEALRRWPA